MKNSKENSQATFKVHSVFTEEIKELGIKHSIHSTKRSQQRGITNEVIALAMTYGIAEQKQGIDWITVRSRDLPKSVPSQLRKKLKKLIVLLAKDDNQIITCYYNDRPVKHIRLQHCEDAKKEKGLA